MGHRKQGSWTTLRGGGWGGVGQNWCAATCFWRFRNDSRTMSMNGQKYTFLEKSLHWQFKHIKIRVTGGTSEKALWLKLKTSWDLSATAKNVSSLKSFGGIGSNFALGHSWGHRIDLQTKFFIPVLVKNIMDWIRKYLYVKKFNLRYP